MKNLVFIIHSLGIGGMERVMTILLNQTFLLPKGKYQIHLILIGRNRNVLQNIDSSVIIHRPHFKFNDDFRTWYTIRTMLFLRSKVKEIRPISILSFGEIWNNLVLISLYGLEYPIYISDRSRPTRNLGRLHNFLRQKLYPRARGFIAQTEKSALNASLKNWNKNIQIIGNPILSTSVESDTEQRVILFVGRLIPTKNVDRLISVFSKAQSAVNEKWTLKIVGGDSQQHKILDSLKEQVVSLKLEEQVIFMGEQQDVESFYKEASIFSFMSTSEGFPNVLGEAMSAFMAVIAYDCIAGPSDLIDNGINGFLVPIQNEEQFTEKLINLMKDKELRSYFGSNAKKKVKEFDQNRIAEKFYNFLLSHENRS